jgi:signal transduction histidine kinase
MPEDGLTLVARVRELSGRIRVRTTALAVIFVGVALVAAAFAMVLLVRVSVTANVRGSALGRAHAVAQRLARQAQDDELDIGDRANEFVQVLDSEGRVALSSPNMRGRPPILGLSPGEIRRIDRVPFESEPFLAVAASAASARGHFTVIVGRSLEAVTESREAIIGLLAAGIPLLLLIVGMVMWRIVGRALNPVDAIRAEVEAISTDELHRRVPDPRSKDEIARLAATMNQMLARLEQGQIRQRRFASDASHELRSPIATIRQHVEVALSHPGEATVEGLAEVVLEEGLRLQRVVEDLLLLAKMDEGTLRLRSEPVDLDDLLFEEAKRLRGTTDVRVDTARVSAGRVWGDRGQLDRLVRNLDDNAARHANSCVVLSLGEGNGEVVLTVDDDGEGIPASERERVFERFVRLDDARDRGSGGSGLGLAIVREIALAHQATVTVLGSPLGGARFEVRFPILAG